MSAPRKTAAEQHMGWCKHYQGSYGPGGLKRDACKAGIPYDAVKDPARKFPNAPCFADAGMTNCPEATFPTREEGEAYEREVHTSLNRTGVARKAIIATGLAAGRIDCPCCGKAGALGFRVSGYNGHVHAGCSTKGCVSWME